MSENQKPGGLERSAGEWKDLIDCEALKRTVLTDRERIPQMQSWPLGVKEPLTRKEIYEYLGEKEEKTE
jgi:hypothetical protein